MWKKTTLGLIAGCTLALGVAGAALGQLQFGGDSPAAPARVAADAPVAPPNAPGNAGAGHQTSRQALRAHLEPSGRKYLDGVDWDSARSFAIPGTRLRGWTFEQPGKRCLAMPDPITEGYGVTCSTPEEIAAGEASVVLLPPREAKAPNIVGVLTSGSATASIDAPQGAASHWARIGDVYAGTAPAGSRLVTAAGSQAIDPPSNDVVPPAASPGR